MLPLAAIPPPLTVIVRAMMMNMPPPLPPAVPGLELSFGLPLPPPPPKAAEVRSSVPASKADDSRDKEQLLARWEDPEHRFELIRFAYGPTYRLIGVLKSLEAAVRVATVEAKRLDDQEAPQRAAARSAAEQEAAKAKLDKTRLTNKAKFRP